MSMTQQRLATFELPELADDLAYERAWNQFDQSLRVLGLRPAEEPTRSSDTTATFRVFDVQIEDEVDTTSVLDFDIAKLFHRGMRLISFAAYPVGMGALVQTIIQAHDHLAATVAGLVS